MPDGPQVTDPDHGVPGPHPGRGGTSQVTQNSFNYAFIAAAIDTDPNTAGIQPYTFGPAEFDVVMTVRKNYGPEINRLHVVFNVTP